VIHAKVKLSKKREEFLDLRLFCISFERFEMFLARLDEFFNSADVYSLCEDLRGQVEGIEGFDASCLEI